MSLRGLWLSWCVLMCMAAPVAAHQVRLGVVQGVEVESNALRSPELPTTDGRYRFTPTVTLEQPESVFSYTLNYRPVYSGYFRTDGVNGWDHQLYGRGRYEASGRDTLRFRANYFDIRGVRSNTVADADGELQVVAVQPGTTQGFDSDLSLEHSFSARWFGSAGLNYNRWDFSNPSRVDNQGFGTELQLNHAPSPRWTVGLGADARYRSFAETLSSPASFSTTLNANLLVRFQLTPKLSLDVSGGPAGVFSQQSTPGPRLVSRWSPVASDPFFCPVGPCGRIWGGIPAPATSPFCATSFGVPMLDTCLPTGLPVTGVPGFPDELVSVPLDPNQTVFGRSTESLTYFGSVALVQRFRSGFLRLQFLRNEDAGSGIGGSTIINSANGTIVYELSDYWRLDLVGSYFVRESVSQFPLTSVSARASSETSTGFTLAEAGPLIATLSTRSFRQEVGSAEASLLRRLSDHSSLRFRFRYYNQVQRAVGGFEATRFDNYTAGVYYVYEFDAYKL